MIFQQKLYLQKDPVILNSVALYEAQLTFKKAAFCLPKQMCTTNLNLLQNMHGEIFLPYKKLPIRWIPI